MPRHLLPLLRAALVAVALVAAACSGDDDAASSTTTTQSTLATTSTTTSTTAPPPAVPPTFEAASACGIQTPDPGGEPVDVPLELDADGDDEIDQAQMRVIDDSLIALVVTYGAGGRSVVVFADDSVTTVGAIRAETAVDIEGDGDDDVWVVVGAGASAEVYSLIVADGCNLYRPGAGSSANAFAAGASAGTSAGIECVDLDGNGVLDGFQTHEGSSADGTTFTGTSTQWFVVGGTLVPGDTVRFELDATSDDFQPYGSLAC